MSDIFFGFFCEVLVRDSSLKDVRGSGVVAVPVGALVDPILLPCVGVGVQLEPHGRPGLLGLGTVFACGSLLLLQSMLFIRGRIWRNKGYGGQKRVKLEENDISTTPQVLYALLQEKSLQFRSVFGYETPKNTN